MAAATTCCRPPSTSYSEDLTMKLRNSSLLIGLAALLPIAAAHAEVVVVVSANSPVTSLTSAQASQIFLAKSVSLPGGAAATPIDIASGAVRDEFYAKVTGKDAAQLKSYRSEERRVGKETGGPYSE